MSDETLDRDGVTAKFGVPPENMVVQGYGEQFLKVPQEGDIRSNRRASVRRITVTDLRAGCLDERKFEITG